MNPKPPPISTPRVTKHTDKLKSEGLQPYKPSFTIPTQYADEYKEAILKAGKRVVARLDREFRVER